MADGVWTVTDRRFVLLSTGQIELYTLGRDGAEIRLTRREVEANVSGGSRLESAVGSSAAATIH
jgi:hypothetical protein